MVVYLSSNEHFLKSSSEFHYFISLIREEEFAAAEATMAMRTGIMSLTSSNLTNFKDPCF